MRKDIIDTARTLGREFVISVTGKVIERYSKSDKLETGAIEITPRKLTIA
jgi:aspartyl-tRNA synthetase